MRDDRALIHDCARHKFWEVIIHLALNPTFKALPSFHFCHSALQIYNGNLGRHRASVAAAAGRRGEVGLAGWLAGQLTFRQV